MLDVEGLIPLPKSSSKRAVNVLTRAFWNDTLNKYFFSSEAQRQQFLPLFLEYRLKQVRFAHSEFQDSKGV